MNTTCSKLQNIRHGKMNTAYSRNIVLFQDRKAVRLVQHYQVTGWPDKGVPRNAQYILDMINKVEGSQRKSSNKAPVVVQCRLMRFLLLPRTVDWKKNNQTGP